ncbi:MAG: formimidoylglutamate deiminase [Gammaproteobacteria bacterium]
MQRLHARHALLPDGWAEEVALRWDDAGNLVEVLAGAPPDASAPTARYVIPGMVNLHSHTFQRALAGLAEVAGEGPDSFWTWRDLMYRFAGAITPAHLHAIAAQAFAEGLRHGYTSVCEFHYLQPATTAQDIIDAARLTGVGITMLPVLYSFAGFGAQPLQPAQARFRTGVDEVLALVARLDAQRDGQVQVGAAPHSLRAASLDQIRTMARALPGRPLHIHVAEQQGEVEQCLAATGARPVRYLLDNVALDAHWCLVHATHLDEGEVAALAASAAVAGLCPTTEANLGDGLFSLEAFIAANGRFGIGSDSHVSHSPVEELRWLEYGQRLLHQRRNCAVGRGERRVSDFLWRQALMGGAAACGRPVGALRAGARADLLVLDDLHPNLADAAPSDVLNRLIFSGNDNLIRDVMAGGRWVVRDHKHVAQEEIAQRYRRTLAQLRTLRS